VTAPARPTTRFASETDIDTVAELMRLIADFAVSAGIGRIDLATAHDNERARGLYEKLGGVVVPAVCYNFPQSAIKKLAQS
jgi:acetyltransferase (GNAT) family protein